MPIKSIQIGQAGVSNRTPSWVYIETNDTYATVTSSGYLNGSAHEYVNSFQQNMMALVSTKTSAGPGYPPSLFLLQFKNNAGVWSLVPSPQSSNLTATVTIPTASVLTSYATPYQLIAAPGAGNIIRVSNVVLYTNFSGSAFTSGGVGVVQYDSTVHGAGTNSLSTTFPAAEITAAASQVYSLGSNSGNALTGITNKGIYFSNQTGAFTGGGATTLTFYIEYKVLTATV